MSTVSTENMWKYVSTALLGFVCSLVLFFFGFNPVSQTDLKETKQELHTNIDRLSKDLKDIDKQIHQIDKSLTVLLEKEKQIKRLQNEEDDDR